MEGGSVEEMREREREIQIRFLVALFPTNTGVEGG